jgi:hypothetical protein
VKNYRTLDAIVVIASLAELAGAGFALVFIRIPEPNLPIFSALVSGSVAATLGAYAGARWGNKKTDEPAAPGDVSVSFAARAAPEHESEKP